MHTRLKLNPGQRGTKKLVAQYGEQLLCVRYRYDSKTKKRYKTIELIVETVDWEPKPQMADDTIVGLRVAYDEDDLRKQVKQAGGRWNSQRRVWEIRFDQVKKLKLESRIVKDGGI